MANCVTGNLSVIRISIFLTGCVKDFGSHYRLACYCYQYYRMKGSISSVGKLVNPAKIIVLKAANQGSMGN
jgi:hypothetical protein